MICGCISPNITLEQFEVSLSDMMELIHGILAELVMEDFNAKAPEWGSPTQDKRGEILTEWLSMLDLVVHNTGEATFIRGTSTLRVRPKTLHPRLQTGQSFRIRG